MEIVYVRIFPVYVRSFPTSSAFTRIWVPCIFAQLPGFRTIYHLFSCCRVQRWHLASIKPGTCMYNSCQITTMAYETWACKNRPYLPGLTLLRNCKQSITSLSLLVGTTVVCVLVYTGASLVFVVCHKVINLVYSLFQYINGDGLSWTGPCACLHVYSRCNKCNSCKHTQDVICLHVQSDKITTIAEQQLIIRSV